MVTPNGSMSTEEETLQFLSYLTGDQYVYSTLSVLRVVQPSSDVPDGLMNIQYIYINRSLRSRMGVKV